MTRKVRTCGNGRSIAASKSKEQQFSLTIHWRAAVVALICLQPRCYVFQAPTVTQKSDADFSRVMQKVKSAFDRSIAVQSGINLHSWLCLTTNTFNRPPAARTFISCLQAAFLVVKITGGQQCKTVCTTRIAESDEFSMRFNINSSIIKYVTTGNFWPPKMAGNNIHQINVRGLYLYD